MYRWTFLGLLFASAAMSAEPSLTKIDIFEADTGGYKLYRIPGIVVTAKGTILAYCEARKTRGHDWDAIDIALRRSTDGGKTWSPMKIIGKVDGELKKNPVALKVKGVKAEDITYNNPVAIVDRKNGSIHFLFCIEYQRCFYMKSDDDGLTFSKPVEITKTFDDFQKDYAFKVLATGPGHAIQMKNGRLVVPVWLSPGDGANAHDPSVTAVIYSDDHGQTWKRGAIAVPDTDEFSEPNETMIEQLVDGRVMLVVRNHAKPHRKIVVTSPNGATEWSKPKLHDQLLEPICMASLCRLSEKPSRLLFSNPHNLEPRPGQQAVAGRHRDRRNLSIKLSYDEGESWPVSKTLEAGSSGYSDLAVLPDGTVLCLYERWNLEGRPAGSYFLTVARFNLEWLTDGKDKLTK
jgi:sialidase-1